MVHLHDHAFESLRHSVKSQTQTLADRLNSVSQELALISSVIDKHAPFKLQGVDARFRGRLLKRFNSIAFFDKPNKLQPFLNQFPIQTLNLTSADIQHMLTGYSLLVELDVKKPRPSLLMIRQVDAQRANNVFIVGEINEDYLWALDEIDNLPLDTELCVLDSSYRLLYASKPSIAAILDLFATETQSSTSGHFEFNTKANQYLASYSQMFLKPNFKIPHWTVILFKTKSDVYAPIEEFKRIYPLFTILAFIVVLWTSIANIRRNLVPIGALKEGVQRIARKDFSQKVIVSSNDEFKELAIAFNEMSDALNHKFKMLSARADIDRAVLSTLNRKDIIKAACTGIAECFAFRDYGISLIGSSLFPTNFVYYSSSLHPQSILKKTVDVTSRDRMVLSQNTDYLIIHDNDSLPGYIPVESKSPMPALLILPIWVRKSLSAVLWIAAKDSKQYTAEDITLTRQLADQIAVALSNSKLIEELKEMDWGTLKALARTVDAKSPWTAGHSLRVTDMAVRIGSALGLRPKRLENLHRAALLHDIGKVGIPSAILNKKSELSDDEFRLIKRHPELGGKIIEPINAFRGIIPIIVQHHERFDGQGYPKKLAGDAIHQGARILAVADVYDALLSDRPYRKRLAIEQVLEIMQKEAGKHFDPVMVRALLKVIKKDHEKAALGEHNSDLVIRHESAGALTFTCHNES
jgi:HD-GYP domain-containing protein (c-di-GMP phosphodiesterase class II)/HAMP domain-containing protein